MNSNSKSEVVIQSETALNAEEADNHSIDQLDAIHQKGTQRCSVVVDTRTCSRRRLQYQERN